MEHPLDLVRQSRARGTTRGRLSRSRGLSWGEARLVVLGGVFLGLALTATTSHRGALGGIARAPGEPAETRSFGLCFTGGGENCVVDGDTFWMDGDKVRVADIDAPETHPPRCDEEARLGDAATLRLQALLNAGPVTLAPIDRDRDRYGRRLRIVERDGVSIGETLVAEGLARPWEGRRRPWCGVGL